MRKPELVGGGVSGAERHGPAHVLARPLDTNESVFHAFGQQNVYAQAHLAEVEGPLDMPLLAAALEAVQRRHPVLRARIVPDGEGLPHFVTPEEPQPIEVERAAEDTSPEALVEAQLHRPFRTEAEPLWRVAWQPAVGDGPHRLVLAVHHSAADGGSIYRVMMDLLTALDALLDGRPLPEPLPPALTLDAALPTPATRPLVQLRRRLQGLRARLLRPQPRLLPPEALAPAASRRTRLHFWVLPQADTARLQQAARAHGTTVGGALTAAMVAAAHRVAGPLPPLPVSVQVCLRAACVPPVPETVVGCYASNVQTPALRADRPFWTTARTAAGAVHAALTDGTCVARLHAARRADPRALARAVAQEVQDPDTGGRHNALSLSNRGRYPSPGTRHFTLRRYFRGVANHPAGNCMSVACGSLDGALMVTLMHVEPLMSVVTGARYADALFDALRRNS